eukprot:TRINITY_DN67412_c0_g1_i1.p1 TRINITY_DN67412_c0_g1~~TRINITY_DN67412_c0_g1_i1.p1  ORF type:complete len:177 (-),score=37.38 TRINITY_DN67412_c0_g1_i1:75-563(-)
MTIPAIEIQIIPPDTESNWMAYYHPADELDSDFLMAPVCEADYDSETQCMVDSRTDGAPKTFHEHFVRKRRKKGKNTPQLPVRTPSIPATLQLHHHKQLLEVPTGFGAIPRGALNNPAVRRLACGRMPPPEVLAMMDSEKGALSACVAFDSASATDQADQAE